MGIVVQTDTGSFKEFPPGEPLDERACFLARVSAREVLVSAGELDLDEALGPLECQTCGCAPCGSPSFCAACQEADRRKKRETDEHTAFLRRLLDPAVSLET